MKIEFLGVGSCMPEYEQADTASLIVNGHILVDKGWHVVRNLLRSNVKPENITHIFFTHMHQDHYLGLAAFLFYLMNGFHTFGNLKIYGPEGVESIVENAVENAQSVRRILKLLLKPALIVLAVILVLKSVISGKKK